MSYGPFGEPSIGTAIGNAVDASVEAIGKLFQ
jgi:hypothetical protein